jgi:hypothetical protein
VNLDEHRATANDIQLFEHTVANMREMNAESTMLYARTVQLQAAAIEAALQQRLTIGDDPLSC